jgi:hypothetical protein
MSHINWAAIDSALSRHGTSFQECPEAKEVWQREVERVFPVGALIRVTASGDGRLKGGFARVTSYDPCTDCGGLGLWPTVQITYISDGHTEAVYDDDIEPLHDLERLVYEVFP